MYQIELKKDYVLGLELQLSSIKLVVYKNGIKQGCRKERIKPLKYFLINQQTELFKGRLRLYKKRSDIIVKFKDQLIGSVYAKEFERVLDEMSNNISLN